MKIRKDIPQSTKEKIIIGSYNFTFDQRAYNEQYLRGKLDREEYDVIIGEINKLITLSFNTKKDYDNIGISKFTVAVIFISIILTISFIVTLNYSTGSNSTIGNDTLFVISIVLMVSVLVLIL